MAKVDGKKTPGSVTTPSGKIVPYGSVNDSAKALFNKLNKNSLFNDGFVHFAPMEAAPPPKEFIPTGIAALDKALGGGIPLGTFGEIFGKNASGKSTLAYNIAVAFQKAGGYVFSIDSEHSWDTDRFVQAGGDLGGLLATEADSLEQIFAAIIEALNNQISTDSAVPLLIIVDTIASTPLAAELTAILGGQTFNDAYGGGRAKYMSQQLRQLPRLVGHSRTSILFINQVRQKMGATAFQDPYDVPGGEAVKHAASYRIKVSMTGQVKVGEEVVGQKVLLQTVKCKTAAPYRKVDLKLVYATGTFDQLQSFIDSLKASGEFKKTRGGVTVGDGLQALGFSDKYETEEAFRKVLESKLDVVSALIAAIPDAPPSDEESTDGAGSADDR